MFNYLKKENGNPFDKCSVCENTLGDEIYFVEKAYRRNTESQKHFVLFEYAMCSKCRMNMMNQISDESKKNIENLIKSLGDRHSVTNLIQHNNPPNSCTFTGKPLSEMNEYHSIQVFRNQRPEFDPMHFGSSIMEAYAEVLSEKTKDFFDDFYDQFIDIPPDLAKILDKDFKPIVL